MIDAHVHPPRCTNENQARNDCGLSAGAIIYFVTFVLIQSYILLNLFVAVVIDVIAFSLVQGGSLLMASDLDHYKVSDSTLQKVVYVCSIELKVYREDVAPFWQIICSRASLHSWQIEIDKPHHFVFDAYLSQS